MNDSLMAEAAEHGQLVRSQSGGVVALTRPELKDVKGQAWFTHPSFSQNPKSYFEVEDGQLFDDYERLEVGNATPPQGTECMHVLRRRHIAVG